MTEEKRPEYVVVEDRKVETAQSILNGLADQGYEVVAATFGGEDDCGNNWTTWTLRLRREQRAARVEATLMDVQRRLDELNEAVINMRRHVSTALAELSRRVEVLEARQAGRATDRGGWLQNASGVNEE